MLTNPPSLPNATRTVPAGPEPQQGSGIESLVIGGGGFLGRALVHLLCASGSCTSVMARQLTEGIESTRLFQGDLCDRESVRTVIRQAKPSRVFHAASLTPAKAQGNIQAMFATNVMGTLHVFEALAKESPGAVTVLCSSGAVYGGSHGEMLSESSPLQPVTVYGASKVAQEMGAVSLWCRTFSLDHSGSTVQSCRPWGTRGLGIFGLLPASCCGGIGARPARCGSRET